MQSSWKNVTFSIAIQYNNHIFTSCNPIAKYICWKSITSPDRMTSNVCCKIYYFNWLSKHKKTQMRSHISQRSALTSFFHILNVMNSTTNNLHFLKNFNIDRLWNSQTLFIITKNKMFPESRPKKSVKTWKHDNISDFSLRIMFNAPRGF